MIPFTDEFPPGAICVATGDLTRFAMFNQSLAMLKVPTGSALIWTSGPLVASNLNHNFEETLKNASLQWAWIMGDDHTFNDDVVLKLLARRRDVIVPLCLNRQPPCAFTILDERNNAHRDFDKIPTSGTFVLEDFEVCGDAGMLLSRPALEKLGPPWYEALISGSKVSEDRYFARKIRDRGMDIHIDAEVTLGHITPCVIQPVHGEQGWNVQFRVGHTPLVEFRPVPAEEPVLA